ncbi:hypothetical protein ODZ84_01875 [Chryseobacterium fluminis]|uniref:hypothetical protein n=1 Tax=Chryseobacterium fluminis TaxID=2983606 RepID=UPI00224FC765|nr:hypothetical protein [Chryseobacterium sp. MMS21-Ot14]UZT98341.1 hypothetical protein ODZ84_01875 [Chryseobacterium sp. MMS21-Ot14]
MPFKKIKWEWKGIEGLELVPIEFLMMSNSVVRPTTPIAETMIRETQIEGIILTGRATPPNWIF